MTQNEVGIVTALPRRPRRRWLRWLALAAVVVILALVLAMLYLTPLLNVRTVKVEGTRLADPQRIQALLDPLKNEPLAKVSTSKVEKLVADEPAIQDLRLGLTGAHSLVVTIVEHREVAVLESGGKRYLVGDNGARLKQVSSGNKVGLPLIKLDVKDPDGKIFETVVEALSQLPPAVLSKLKNAGAKSVDSVSFDLTDGRQVVWGDASEGAWKAADLEAMLADGGPKDKIIDVSTPSRPVTR